MLARLIFGLFVFWIAASLLRSILEGISVQTGGGHRRRRPGGGRPRRPRPTSNGRRRALKTLGLGPGASREEIRGAYKRLAQKYHPDRVAHLGPELVELTSEKFREVQEAYELLDGRA